MRHLVKARNDELPVVAAPPHGAVRGVLPRLAHQSMQDRVYGELKLAVMAGAFSPGQAITTQELADRFGTSTMPIRDALRRLAAERVMITLSNRSVAVPELTAERFEDLLRVRIVLEGQAVEWATQHLTPQELAELARINAEMNKRVVQKDVNRFLVLNQEFHFAIYRAARSAVLLPVIEGMWLQIGPYINLLIHAMTGERRRNVRHDAAFQALRSGDAASARREVVGDLEDSAARIRPLLSSGVQAVG